MKKFPVLAAALLALAGCSHNMSLKITDLGAVSGGEFDNALIINAAIDSCCRAGGGTVIVPAGQFMSGTIYLKAGVELRLDKGAELLASRNLASYGHYVTDKDMSKYDTGVGTANQNCASDTIWTQALIIGRQADGASITGHGRIDGGSIDNHLGEEGMRGPHTVLVAETSDFTMSDISIDNSSNYAVLCYDLSDSRFSGVRITGGWDGIHIRGGENINVSECDFSTGDDSMAGGYWHNMVIDRCHFNSSCNGLRMIMPSENVRISGCTFIGPGRSPHRTTSDKGGNMLHAMIFEPGGWGDAPGTLSGISVVDCVADSVMSPFCMTLLDDNHCTDVTIDGYHATNCRVMALSVKSWGSAVTDKVTISNSAFSYIGVPELGLGERIASMPFDQWPYFPSYGAYFRNVGEVVLDNVAFSTTSPDDRQDVYTDNVGRVERLP